MHLYEVAGSRQKRQKLHANNETERITSFNDRQEEYTSLRGPQQEESSEYQQPQQCGRNTKTAENKILKGASEYHVLKDELKQTKVCLRVLSLLIIILFLMTSLCLGLAAYCLSSTRSGNDFLNSRLNGIDSSLRSQLTRILINSSFQGTVTSQPSKNGIHTYIDIEYQHIP